MSDSNETVILDDGSIVKVPGLNNMSEGEITNALIKALPEKMGNLGFLPDIEREYNIRDGVPDLNLRFSEALAAGNPKEIKAVFFITNKQTFFVFKYFRRNGNFNTLI